MSDEQIVDLKSLLDSLDQDEASRREEANKLRLQHRARQYAALLPDERADDDRAFTVLAFTLGAEQYACDVMLVQAVRTLPRITPVPGVPAFYRGVVNLRGKITTVIDLRLFFDISTEEAAPPGELVVVRSNNLEMGLLAHYVQGVVSVPYALLEPMPDMRYARGVTADRLVLLDLAPLFEDNRLIIGDMDS